MKTIYERTKVERNIIRKAYEFEIYAIEHDDYSRNPFFDTIKSMDEGNEVWEAINVAVEMKYI